MHFLAPNSFHDSLICKTIYWEIEISSLDKRILKDLELDRFEDIFIFLNWALKQLPSKIGI